MVHVETKALPRSGCERVGSDALFAGYAFDRLSHQNHLEGASPIPAGESWLTSAALRHFEVSDDEALRRRGR